MNDGDRSTGEGRGWLAATVQALLRPFVSIADRLPLQKLSSGQTLAAVAIICGTGVSIAYFAIVRHPVYSLVLAIAVLVFAVYMYSMTKT